MLNMLRMMAPPSDLALLPLPTLLALREVNQSGCIAVPDVATDLQCSGELRLGPGQTAPCWIPGPHRLELVVLQRADDVLVRHSGPGCWKRQSIPDSMRVRWRRKRRRRRGPLKAVGERGWGRGSERVERLGRLTRWRPLLPVMRERDGIALGEEEGRGVAHRRYLSRYRSFDVVPGMTQIQVLSTSEKFVVTTVVSSNTVAYTSRSSSNTGWAPSEVHTTPPVTRAAGADVHSVHVVKLFAAVCARETTVPKQQHWSLHFSFAD